MAPGCVVCGNAIVGEPVYANAWERGRKRLPCCSPPCAAAFDPDQHWIPAVLPAIAVGDELANLRGLARRRLQALDLPGPVVRELLGVGLAPAVLRALVEASRAASAAARRRNNKGFLIAILRRRIRKQDPDERTERDYTSAIADLDRWDAEAARRGAGARR